MAERKKKKESQFQKDVQQRETNVSPKHMQQLAEEDPSCLDMMSTSTKLGAVMTICFIFCALVFWYAVPDAFEDPTHVLVFMSVFGVGCVAVFIVWIFKTIAEHGHGRHMRNREAEECVYRAFQNNGFRDATLLVVQYAVCEKQYFVTTENLRLFQGIFPPLENYMEFKEFSKEVAKVLPKTWHKYTEDEMRKIDKKQLPVRRAYDALMAASMDLVVAKEFLTGMGEYYTIEQLQSLKDMYAATASRLAGNMTLDFAAFLDVFNMVAEKNAWKPLSKDKMEQRDRKQRRADMKTEVGEAYDSDEVNADECNNDAKMAASLQAAEVAGANADRSQARKQRMQAMQSKLTSGRAFLDPVAALPDIGKKDKGGVPQSKSSDEHEESEAEDYQGAGDWHDGDDHGGGDWHDDDNHGWEYDHEADYEQGGEHDHVDESMSLEDRQAVVAAIDDRLAALGHGKQDDDDVGSKKQSSPPLHRNDSAAIRDELSSDEYEQSSDDDSPADNPMVVTRSFNFQRNDSFEIRNESTKSLQQQDTRVRLASLSGGRVVV
jgi:hypothetical protein